MKLVYPAILTPCIEKEGYTIEIPDLPGCISEGKDMADAIEMGKDAACGWIIDELENGNHVPQQLFPFKEPELINSKKIISLLVLNIDQYAKDHGNKSVRKNVTIPEYLNSYAAKNNVNLSKLLQEALLNLISKKCNTKKGEQICH